MIEKKREAWLLRIEINIQKAEMELDRVDDKIQVDNNIMWKNIDEKKNKRNY